MLFCNQRALPKIWYLKNMNTTMKQNEATNPFAVFNRIRSKEEGKISSVREILLQHCSTEENPTTRIF